MIVHDFISWHTPRKCHNCYFTAIYFNQLGQDFFFFITVSYSILINNKNANAFSTAKVVALCDENVLTLLELTIVQLMALEISLPATALFSRRKINFLFAECNLRNCHIIENFVHLPSRSSYCNSVNY